MYPICATDEYAIILFKSLELIAFIEPIVIARTPSTNKMSSTLDALITSIPNTLYISLIMSMMYALRTSPERTADEPDVEEPCASGSQEWNG